MGNYMKRSYVLLRSILMLKLILQNSLIYAMDLEICLDQFDIHHNMIIRTEESLTIGGVFLQSTRLDTEIECRRLCCETEKCDVYIFEEKNESYCYVFSCGPPENFKCKFTKHANFTSSVLIPVVRYSTTSTTTTTTTTVKPTLYQQLKIQSNQPISQQELELTNLKSSKAHQNLNVMKITTTLNPIKSTQSCGRFQFKCHSGECIAIYNACNGIVQCEDGSDEGSECAENNAIENANSKSQNRITNTKQNNIQSSARQYQPVEIPTLNNREDPMSSPPIWMNRRPIQDIHPNIGDIQMPGNIPSNMPNQPNNMYIPMSNMQNPYILKPSDHMMMMPPNMNWDPSTMKQLQQMVPMNNLPFDGINNNERFIQQQRQLQPQPQPQSPSAIKITQENLENLPSAQNIATASENSINTNVQENQKVPILSKQQNSELSEDSTETSGENTQTSKKTSNKHNQKQKEPETENKINEQKDFVETYPFHEEYRMEFKDHDGYSDRPSGAIISLVLGLLVTACLALLIGCKMRTVGRRRVRVKGSFNDADFLVNGMYL